MVTSLDRKAENGRVRRFMAVLLCCVLVFYLVVREQKPAGAVSVSVAGSAATTGMEAVSSTVGWIALAAVGVEFVSGYFNLGNGAVVYDTPAYNLGAAAWNYLYNQGASVVQWCDNTINKFLGKGGVTAGDTFEIPTHIANLLKTWAGENLDFTGENGTVIYSSSYIASGDDLLLFSEFASNAVYNRWSELEKIGTLIQVPYGQVRTFTFSTTEGNVYRHEFIGEDNGGMTVNYYKNDVLMGTRDAGSSTAWAYGLVPASATSSLKYLCPIKYSIPDGKALYSTIYLTSLDNFYPRGSVLPIGQAETVVSAGPSLDLEATDELAVAVPADLPYVNIGDWTVPVPSVVTAQDVLNPSLPDEDDPAVPVPVPGGGITVGQAQDLINTAVNDITQAIPGAVAQALPITGSIAGDQVVEETLTEPQSIGGVLTTRFPFCIPWDIVRCIKLLAVPMRYPRLEFDFLDPISDLVGGFDGDTTIVVDFETSPMYEVALISRFFSTIFFVYWLASKTKDFIWPA